MHAEQEPHLRANGWREEPGLGWVDPAPVAGKGAPGAIWSRDKALRIQRLRDTFAPLHAAGWRVYRAGAPRDDAPTGDTQLWDPDPAPGLRRVCRLQTALERQMQREQLGRGWPHPPPEPPSLTPPAPVDPAASPERFLDLEEGQRGLLLLWIRSVMKPASSESSATSAGLRLFCEDEVIFSISNGAMKGAMMTAGIAPRAPAAEEATYNIRPLRATLRGRKQTMARCWFDNGEVYTLLDADAAVRERFLANRAEVLREPASSPPGSIGPLPAR